MKKLLVSLALITIPFMCLKAQSTYEIDAISSFGKKIVANGSSIAFSDTEVVFVTSVGGKTSTHNLKIVTKDLTKNPPTYNCSGKIGENNLHQFKLIASKHLIVWNSIKEDKTVVERFLFIKQEGN